MFCSSLKICRLFLLLRGKQYSYRKAKVDPYKRFFFFAKAMPRLDMDFIRCTLLGHLIGVSDIISGTLPRFPSMPTVYSKTQCLVLERGMLEKGGRANIKRRETTS